MDDRHAEEAAIWDALEDAWGERVESKMDELELRALVMALHGRLRGYRSELAAAERDLATALDRVQRTKAMCLAIADTIETSARTLGVAA